MIANGYAQELGISIDFDPSEQEVIIGTSGGSVLNKTVNNG
jgi:hypothetical protein